MCNHEWGLTPNKLNLLSEGGENMNDLENRVCNMSLRLIDLLNECEDEDFVNTICSAIMNADYGTIWNLQEQSE